MQGSNLYIILFDCNSGFEIKPVPSENLTYNYLCHFIDGPMPMVYEDIFRREGFTTLVYFREEDFDESYMLAKKNNELSFNEYLLTFKSQDQFFETTVHGKAVFVRGFGVQEIRGWSYDEAIEIVSFLSVKKVSRLRDDTLL